MKRIFKIENQESSLLNYLLFKTIYMTAVLSEFKVSSGRFYMIKSTFS